MGRLSRDEAEGTAEYSRRGCCSRTLGARRGGIFAGETKVQNEDHKSEQTRARKENPRRPRIYMEAPWLRHHAGIRRG